MSWPQPATCQSLNTPPFQDLDTGNAASVSCSISDIYYGTLVMGAAMRNIHKRRSSIIPSDDEFGVIGHPFDRNGFNIPFTITLNSEKRTTALVGSSTSSTEETTSSGVLLSIESGTSRELFISE